MQQEWPADVTESTTSVGKATTALRGNSKGGNERISTAGEESGLFVSSRGKKGVDTNGRAFRCKVGEKRHPRKSLQVIVTSMAKGIANANQDWSRFQIYFIALRGSTEPTVDAVGVWNSGLGHTDDAMILWESLSTVSFG